MGTAAPEDVASFALRFTEVTQEQPFGPGTDVYKVAGKVFVILSPEHSPPTQPLEVRARTRDSPP